MLESYYEWLNYPLLDPEIKNELLQCKFDNSEIEDRFFKDLEFGTGGLRGVIGAGTNRMNIYTVNKATRGLAAYLNKRYTSPSCAIAYDSRNKSLEFAKIAAATLADAGIMVWIYSELMPTPMLSYAVRQLHCSAGIVITASHNPAKYNGYKVYQDDGCQITLDAADEIQHFINLQKLFSCALPLYDQMESLGSIQLIGNDIIERYLNMTQSLVLNKPTVPLKIVYSPLNGSGNKPVRETLRRLGNMNVTVVPAQEMPDGNFPTCPYPNPEIKQAVQLAADLALMEKADLFIATDPDCDRVGVGIPVEGKIQLINGNEIGVLLFDYICKMRQQHHNMPQNPIAVKTIVTTDMAKPIAKKYNVKLIEVLTGFKFIGEQIGLLDEQNCPENFLFGFEESYGYLSGTAVRDKDAVNASLLICEMAAYYKERGTTLVQALENLYSEYGYFKSELLSFEFSGATGMKSMEDKMNSLRNRNLKTFAGKPIANITDYLNDFTGLPKSNVIAIELADSLKIIIRPSGTEPKIKLYLSAIAPEPVTSANNLIELCTSCEKWINGIVL